MPEEKGTGKHPHKSSEEPWPHREEEGKEQKTAQRQSRPKTMGAGSSSSGDRGESADEKAREYRDEQGNIHHHTRTYMQQHKGEK